MKRIFVVTSLLAIMPVASMAQSFTYNHDASVMNQFLVGETGAGSLTPDWYYDMLHKSYRNGAMTTNKQFFRTQMKMLALNKEEGHAEALDSALTERKRVEFLNIADRTPGVTDVAWQVEKPKIESKMVLLKENIEKITLYGGTSAQYRQWLERYNAINCGLQAVRDAYMPQGKRKEQYLEIYKDVLAKNVEVCELLAYLRYEQEIKKHPKKALPSPRSYMGRIARSAHGRWKVAMAAGSGFQGQEFEDNPVEDLLNNQ